MSISLSSLLKLWVESIKLLEEQLNKKIIIDNVYSLSVIRFFILTMKVTILFGHPKRNKNGTY